MARRYTNTMIEFNPKNTSFKIQNSGMAAGLPKKQVRDAGLKVPIDHGKSG